MPSSPLLVAMAIMITSDGWIRTERNRTAVAVRHKPRTAGASVQNIAPSAHARKKRFNTNQGRHIKKEWERTMAAKRDASACAPWRSKRARMPRSRRTLCVYAASAPIGSVSCESSSTADCASARVSATVRLQDRVCLDALGGGGGFSFDAHVMSRAVSGW